MMKNLLGFCGNAVVIACWISVFQPHTAAAIGGEK
jgi:hypothetical protein